MAKTRKYLIFTLSLSILSILALILSHLALTDIYHGGEDLSMEWSSLRITAIVFALFITSTIFTVRKVLKTYHKSAMM